MSFRRGVQKHRILKVYVGEEEGLTDTEALEKADLYVAGGSGWKRIHELITDGYLEEKGMRKGRFNTPVRYCVITETGLWALRTVART